MSAQIITTHELQLDGQNQIVHEDGTNFDDKNYSLMKYGDSDATHGFASELVDVILQEVPNLVLDDQPPEFLVAYKEVPPACFYLSRYVLDQLNLHRLENGQEPGRLIRVYKGAVTATNYATATAEDRHRELQGIDFTLEGRELRDKPIVVLDDIRITGGAEERILEVILPAKPMATLLGYTAIFDAEQAKRRPTVENDLNTAVVKTAADVLPAIERNTFDLNIRTLKLILATPRKDLCTFLERVPTLTIEDMLRGTVNTGPKFIGQYRDSYDTLRRVAKGRGL